MPDVLHVQFEKSLNGEEIDNRCHHRDSYSDSHIGTHRHFGYIIRRAGNNKSEENGKHPDRGQSDHQDQGEETSLRLE